MEGFSAQPGPVRRVILVKVGPAQLSGECFMRGSNLSKKKKKNRSKKQCDVFKELKEMRILEASKGVGH